MLGETEGQRRRAQLRMRWLESITDSTHKNLSNLQGSLMCCSLWGCKESDMTEQQANIIQKSLQFLDFHEV